MGCVSIGSLSNLVRNWVKLTGRSFFQCNMHIFIVYSDSNVKTTHLFFEKNFDKNYFWSSQWLSKSITWPDLIITPERKLLGQINFKFNYGYELYVREHIKWISRTFYVFSNVVFIFTTKSKVFSQKCFLRPLSACDHVINFEGQLEK